MEHFAELKTQELHIIDAENSRRAAGLQTTKRFEDQKASLSAEMEAAQGNGNVDSAAALRSEASQARQGDRGTRGQAIDYESTT